MISEHKINYQFGPPPPGVGPPEIVCFSNQTDFTATRVPDSPVTPKQAEHEHSGGPRSHRRSSAPFHWHTHELESLRTQLSAFAPPEEAPYPLPQPET